MPQNHEPLTLIFFEGPLNVRAQRVEAFAALIGVPLNVRKISPGSDNEQLAYLQNCHPLGRQPVLHTSDGYIFESNAITRYLARLSEPSSGLAGASPCHSPVIRFPYGTTTHEHSQVDMWLDFALTELDPNGFCFAVNCFQGVKNTALQEDKAREVLWGLDAWLETRTYLVGERMSAADVVVGFSLQWFFHFNPESGEVLAKTFRNVYRLYNTVMQQPPTVVVLRAHGASFGAVKKPEEV